MREGFLYEKFALINARSGVRYAYRVPPVMRRRLNSTREMLDLIFKTRCCDLGHVYNRGGIFDRQPYSQKNAEFVSAYEKLIPKIETGVHKAIENFTENTQ